MLYKGKGDRTDVNSYRGLALNAVTYKIFTKLLMNRLRNATVEHIPQEQYGFMPKRSTIQAMRRFIEAVNWTLYHKHRFVYAVYIDYTKAFDSVPRATLINTLSQLGVHGSFLCRCDEALTISTNI